MSSKTSSKTGSEHSSLKHFSAEDICRILRASASLSLKAIKIGELKISFYSEAPKKPKEEKQTFTQAGQPEVTQKEVPGELISDEELKNTLDEIEAENFMIQDPAAYEKQILDERVFDERDDLGEPSARRSKRSGRAS